MLWIKNWLIQFFLRFLEKKRKKETLSVNSKFNELGQKVDFFMADLDGKTKKIAVLFSHGVAVVLEPFEIIIPNFIEEKQSCFWVADADF